LIKNERYEQEKNSVHISFTVSDFWVYGKAWVINPSVENCKKKDPHHEKFKE